MNGYALRVLRIAALAICAGLMACNTLPSSFAAGLVPGPPLRMSVTSADWEAYKAAFLRPDGRIVDTANDNISHSEGQGYGMLLAAAADDQAAFERIWAFTRTELLVRDDGLAAWVWRPEASPHVTDVNNATDGDLLIAYALYLASERWNNPIYREAARRISTAIADLLIVDIDGGAYLLPGATGFRKPEEPDTIVINPSYWVFPALRMLQRLGSAERLDKTMTTGLEVLGKARFGDRKLPADWLQVSPSGIVPDPARTPVFGYDGLRIPLYLMLAGYNQPAVLQPFYDDWVQRDRGTPMIVDLNTGATRETPNDPGYRILAALVACATAGTPIPEDLKSFSPTMYYPSTLHLLGLSLARGGYPQC